MNFIKLPHRDVLLNLDEIVEIWTSEEDVKAEIEWIPDGKYKVFFGRIPFGTKYRHVFKTHRHIEYCLHYLCSKNGVRRYETYLVKSERDADFKYIQQYLTSI